MKSTYVRSQYRLRKELDEWLSRQSQKNHRSKNGELNEIIERMKKAEEMAS